MKISPSVLKIVKKEIETLLDAKKLSKLLEKLLAGDLLGFEEDLYKKTSKLYDKIAKTLIVFVSKKKEFKRKQEDLAKKKGLKKLVSRQANIQLRTGSKIRYQSYYAKKCPEKYKSERHLSRLYWSTQKGASPMYSSIITMLSVICPSFDVASSVLKHQQIVANLDRVREVALSTSNSCMKDRVNIQLESNESLKNKRVVIEMDGGRTRIRKHILKEGVAGKKYETPWIEPKMFVITTIDENGKINKEKLPIYDTTYRDDETFELLEKYLVKLEIEKSKSVQFIADGAVWIWKRAKQLFLKMGVKASKIIETLDYYHASEHLHDLKIYMDKDKEKSIFKKLKEQLWEGNIVQMGRLIKEAIPDVDLAKFTPFQYFVKNQERINYQYYRSIENPIGSGAIESGIRRIINLRFKSPSSFWYPENVEKLVFMRGVALSGRWNIMMKNLTKNEL